MVGELTRPVHVPSHCLLDRERLISKAALSKGSYAKLQIVEGGIVDEAEIGTPPDVGRSGRDTSKIEVSSNEDLAKTRRQQQVRQACQQCCRMKIKVQICHSKSTLYSLGKRFTEQFEGFSAAADQRSLQVARMKSSKL